MAHGPLRLALAAAALALAAAGCGPKYDIVHDSWGTQVVKSKETGKYAFRDHDTQKILVADLPYTEIGAAAGGLFKFRDANGKYGYLGPDGKVAIPAQYKYAEDMGSNRYIGFPEKAIVQNDAGLFGVIAKDGSFIFPIEFAKIEPVPKTYLLYTVTPDGKFNLCHRDTGKQADIALLNSENERANRQMQKEGNYGKWETCEAFLLMADIIERMPPTPNLDKGIVAHWRKHWGEIYEWTKKNHPK